MSIWSWLEGQEGQEGQVHTHSFPGYRSGGDSPASTLLPGVDPDTAAAVVRSREALHRNRPKVDFDPARPSGTKLPRLGEAKRIEQWSMEIRAENLMAELTGPLQRAGDEKEESYALLHQGELIVKIIRPERNLFQEQVQLVVDAVPLRPERLQELIVQIGIPVQFWSSILDLNPTTTPFTLELLALAMAFGSAVNQPCKHTLGCPRPATYSPSVQPVINPRRFGAFPSGHAMEAFMTARLLQILTKQRTTIKLPSGKDAETGLEQQLQRLAMRIADHRVIAGVHFHIDSTAGHMVGETLANYLAYRCQNPDTKGWIGRVFDGKAVAAWPHAFSRHDKLDNPKPKSDEAPFFQQNPNPPVPKTAPPYVVVKGGESLLKWLWDKAQAEWA